MVVIQITRDDLNRIKAIEDLLVSQNTSYISFQRSLISDMNDNRVVSVPPSAAIRADGFIGDASGPRVVGFDLDMDAGILSVYFRETVNVRSVNLSCLAILSDPTGNGAHRLTGGTLLMPYGLDDELAGGGGSGFGGSNNNNTVDGGGSEMGGSSGSGNSSLDSAIAGAGGADDNVFTPLVGSGSEFDRFVVLTDEMASRDATAIFVDITLQDLNAIKRLRIAETRGTTFLRADSCAVLDQSNLPLVPALPSLGVRFHTNDTTPPQLQEFDFDLDAGRLTMRFSETVAGFSLMASQLTLQGRRTSSSESLDLFHTLLLESYVAGIDSTGGLETEVSLIVKTLDLNRIKQLTELATSPADTFISITSMAITDTLGNVVVRIPQSAALQVTRYDRDQTRPRLLSFILDLNGDVLTLVFDETVSGSTLDETQVILQEYQVNTFGDSAYRLVDSPHDRNDSTVIKVYLSFEDRNAIKRIEDLATRERNTWLMFDAALVNDTSGNRVVEVENAPSLDTPGKTFVSDTVPPRLLGYSLNLTSETLSLSFSETVNGRTFDITELLLLNGEPLNAPTNAVYRLTQSSTLLSENSAFFDLRLSLEDLNGIKRLTGLATNRNNTFLSFGSSLVQDMNTNPVIEETSGDPLQVAVFEEDVIPPALLSFDLDLTTEVLTLSFSETVDPSLLDLAGITLQQDENVDPDDVFAAAERAYQLTGGSIFIENLFDPVLRINLTNVDLNNIKRLFNLATEEDNTFLSFASSLIMDMNANPVVASSPFMATRVLSYTRDATPPVLTSFSLDIDTADLRLFFSEVVNIDTFDLTSLYLQSLSSDPTHSVRLERSDVSFANDTTISVSLSRHNLDNIKRNVRVGISNASTNLAIPRPSLQDMAQNLLVAVPVTSALPVVSFRADSRPPILEEVDVDLDSGVVTLHFDEVVNLRTLNLSLLTLQAAANVSKLNADSEILTLDGNGEIPESRNEPSVSIRLSTEDLNTLKRRPLCLSGTSCYLSFPAGAVSDMAGFPVGEISPFRARLVANFTADTTPPRLVRFVSLDLNNGTLELVFDETVNVDSFNFSGIVLQSFFRAPQATVSLTGGSTTTASENGTFVTVDLSPSDLLRLKEDERVCSNSNNCWLRVGGGTVADTNGNAILPVPDGGALDAETVLEDTVRPTLLGFRLDVQDGVLTLRFDEPVRPSTLDPRGIYIQRAENASDPVQLTTASSTDSDNGETVVVIALSRGDLERLKATDFAKSLDDTFLRLEAFAIRDVAVRTTNDVVPLPNGRAQRAEAYVGDTEPPRLLEFSLDLISEVIALTFDEPIRPSTLDVTEITLLSSEDDEVGDDLQVMAPVVRVPLTSGTVRGEGASDGTFSFSIELNREAILALKLNDNIATSETDTYISFASAALMDTAGNFVAPVPPEMAVRATLVTQDDTSTPPTLDSYTLSLDAGRLALTFTDVVQAATLRLDAITIQNAPLGSVGVTLTDGISSTNSSDGYVIVVDIGTSDLNRIKLNTSLATELGNTYLVLRSNVFRDLQGADIVPVSDGNAVPPTRYVSDATQPSLLGFTLDLDSGQLALSFSETVNVRTLNVSGITLQSAIAANLSKTSFVRLTSSPAYPIGSRSASDNGASFVVDLGSQDLNEIKRLTNLGTSAGNAFLSIPGNSVSDMVDLGNTETPPELAVGLLEAIVPDRTDPALVEYDLDLNRGQFLLTFSETVRASSLNVNGIVVQNSSDTFLDRVRLRSSWGSRTASQDSTTIVVDLGRDDLNDIKRNRLLATSVLDTYLFLTNYVIRDTSGNPNVPRYNPMALRVDGVTTDVSSPFLLSFDLDLTQAELLLTFDETVETSSLMIQEIVLQSRRDALGGVDDVFGGSSGVSGIGNVSGSGLNASGSGLGDDNVDLVVVSSWRLTPGSLPLRSQSFSGDDPVVVVSLGEVDFNALARLTDLATSINDTFISFSSAVIRDMSGNSAVEVSRSNGVQATRLTPDTIAPTLRAFDLDMNTGDVTFTFSETINARSFNGSLVVLQDSSVQQPSASYRLTGGTVLSDDSTVLVLRITVDDLNNIKNDSRLLTSRLNTHLRLLSGAVLDMNANPIDNSDVLAVTNFTQDVTSPVLVAFDFNLSTDELVLVFDETVDTDSLVVRGILLQQSSDISVGGAFYRLQPPTGTASPDSTAFVIALSRVDSNEIKRMTSLAVDEDSLHISLAEFTLTDTNGNNVTVVPVGRAMRVRQYTPDRVRPVLEAFHLNLDANRLILSFDETIDVTSMPRYPYIVLHNGETLNSSNREQALLSGGDIANTDHSRVLLIDFRLRDVNNIKLYSDFGTTVSDTYLTIADGTVRDLGTPSSNGLVGTTLQADTVVPDEVSPRLLDFRVDLNAEILVLFFDEPVNSSSLLISGLTVQDARRSRTGVQLVTSSTASGNGEAIVVNITNDDLDEIKRIDTLFIDADTSYLTLTPDFVRDMSGNPVVAILNGFALRASAYQEDLRRPYVVSYGLDMDSGRVSLSFSETVNVSSFRCDQLTFSSSPDCGVNYTLTDCVVDTANISLNSLDVGTSGSGSTDFDSATRYMTDFHYADAFAFYLTLFDQNQLKALEIGLAQATTFLAYTNATVQDQSDLQLLERDCATMSLPIGDPSDFVPDTTGPRLRRFDFSLNTGNEGKLVLYFTETVFTGTLNPREFLLLEARDRANAAQSYRLGDAGDNGTMSFDGPTDVVTVYVSAIDANAIKFRDDLAVSNETLYLAASAMAVRDASGNPLAEVSEFDAQRVRLFTPDQVPPRLVSYAFDLNRGQVRFTFDETVNVGTLVFTSLTFQVVSNLSVFDRDRSNLTNGTDSEQGSGNVTDPLSRYDSCGILWFTLAGGAVVSPLNSTLVTIALTRDDLNDIKRETCLATNETNTYLSVGRDGILDMNDNGILAIPQDDAEMAARLVPDALPPFLQRFDLNMSSEVLTLYFDETVDASSFDPTQITFLSSNIEATNISANVTVFESFTVEVNYTLTSFGELLNGDDPTLRFKISKVDVDAIKALASLATEPENTFVSVTSTLVADMSGNPVSSIDQQRAVQVDNFTEDAIPPVLVAFDLDMDLEVLTLTFDETVNVSSLNFSGLTLLSSRTAAPLQLYSLNGGSPSFFTYTASPNQPVVEIFLGYLDINKIKELVELATSNETTFLSITRGAVLDMNDNPLVGVAFRSALVVSDYNRDGTPPVLVGYDLDLDVGLLTLEFRETVNASSLALDKLTLQNDAAIVAAISFLTPYNSSVRPENSVRLYVEFGVNFFNELKRVDDLATGEGNTFLSFPETALLDMAGNVVEPVDNSSARPVRTFVADSNRPALLSYQLDMNAGLLVLYFNETVRTSTLDTTQITLSQTSRLPSLQANGGSSNDTNATSPGSGSGSGLSNDSSEAYTLTGGMVQEANSHRVEISLSLTDLNQIKRLRNLATSRDNTYLSLTSQAVYDMYNNSVVAVEDDNRLQASVFVVDDTLPDVIRYHLDLDNNTLTILFSETIDSTTLVIPGTITFYNASDFVGASYYTLQGSTSDSSDGPLVVVDLSPGDSNRLKFIRDLAESIDTTYLFLDGTVSDMAGNVVTRLYMGRNETRPADNFTADATPPELLSFELDLDASALHFFFSETVDNVEVREITLQSDRFTTNETEAYTLTSSADIFGPSLLPGGPGFPPEFTVTLTESDLNAVKALLNLATSHVSTYLSVTSLFVRDTFDNELVEILPENALPVSAFTSDIMLPRLSEFLFDADQGRLSLTFDETVSSSSLNVTGITLVNPLTGTEYTFRDQPPLAGATLSPLDSTVLDLTLSNDDLNQLKVRTDLATTLQDTYVVLEATAISDTGNNALNISNMPLRVAAYLNDTTRPELVDFDLDLNSNLLVLSFTEAVNVSTLDISQIALHSVQFGNDTNSSYSLQQQQGFDHPLGSVTRSSDGPIVRLDLGQVDLNEIKRIQALAVDRSSTFLSISPSGIADMVGLEVVAVEETDALPVRQYGADATRPVLLEFSFDLNRGEILFTFNETVNLETFDQTAVTIEDSEASLASHTLTLGRPVGRNDPVVLFPLQFYDLNRIKLERELATSLNNTHLRLGREAVRDMADNPVEPNFSIASDFTDDETRPTLTEYEIDINASLLILNFDEPVDRLTLRIGEIVFQSSSVRSTDPALYYRLQRSTSDSSDGLVLRISIDVDDLNEIKQRPGLLVSEDTSYLSFSQTLVSDMRGNPVEPASAVNASRADIFLLDDTRPRLSEFHLDMDASLLHLTFPETVNASSVDFTAFTLQADSQVRDEQMQYRLTGGDLASYAAGTVVTINITLVDLNELKRREIATSRRTSWLLVEATGIQDQNGLSILPLVDGLNATQASRYTIDATRPVLQAFRLDLDTGDVTFSFSETVRASSLNLTSVTLQSTAESTGFDHMYSLVDRGTRISPAVPDNSHVVTYRMSTFDLNAIKRRTLLATGVENTFVSIRSSTIFDMQTNFLVPLPNGGALQASRVTPDTTPPTLLSFKLDMDSADLLLTFDETVNTSTLDPTGIVFTSGLDIEPSYRLTGGFMVEAYSTVLSMNLNDFDYDALKIETELCTGYAATAGDCELTLDGNSVEDASGNPNNASVVAPLPGEASITPDTTPPYLVYYDLDFEVNELRLTFSEVVRVSPETATPLISPSWPTLSSLTPRPTPAMELSWTKTTLPHTGGH